MKFSVLAFSKAKPAEHIQTMDRVCLC